MLHLHLLRFWAFLYILLTLHPNKIFLNKPTWCISFLTYLFLFSTCFGQLCAHHQMNQLYQCDTWYLSLCVDDCLVCRTVYRPAYQTVIYTEWHIPGVALINLLSWWWAHSCPKHVENRNKYMRKIVHQVGLFTNISGLCFFRLTFKRKGQYFLVFVLLYAVLLLSYHCVTLFEYHMRRGKPLLQEHDNSV